MRPFRLPQHGQITHEWLKATLLQLDPDDDEAEQKVRMALERRSERQLRQALEEWLRTAMVGVTAMTVPQIASRLRNGSSNFRDVLQRALVDSVDLGVSVAVDQMDTIGFGFDYTLANSHAREWARTYTDDVLQTLNTTNDRLVGEAVARWVDNGEPLEALENDLAKHFGRTRARTISATEVTRAYAEGSMQAYRESGVTTHVEWRTANDERVCPVCGPLGGLSMANGEAQPVGIDDQDGQRANLDNPTFTHPNGQTYGPPPAHPNCRCWVVAVIEES